MQEITYASKSFVTTDEIAECLLELVTAIDRNSHAEAVTVPTFTDTGRQTEAKITLDAGSELVAVPVTLDTDDSFDKQLVDTALQTIRDRITKVGRGSAVVYAKPTDQPDPAATYLDDFQQEDFLHEDWQVHIACQQDFAAHSIDN